MVLKSITSSHNLFLKSSRVFFSIGALLYCYNWKIRYVLCARPNKAVLNAYFYFKPLVTPYNHSELLFSSLLYYNMNLCYDKKIMANYGYPLYIFEL